MKQFIYMFFTLCFFLMMLLFPKQSFEGAANGLLLWFQMIIPTLLPCLIFSNFLVYTNSVFFLSKWLKYLFQRVFHVSECACYAILIGFVCGYPMGAKVIADLISTKQISHREGAYLLSFCNNTSPAFIISYLVTQHLSGNFFIPTLIILYASPISCSFIFRRYYRINSLKSYPPKKSFPSLNFQFSIFDHCIMNGFEAITKIGGYIILFSILFNLLFGTPLKWILPFLEISGGIAYLSALPLSVEFTYPALLAVTSFGGLCSIAQTSSMLQDSGLSIFSYTIQKLITSTVTSFFAFIYIVLIHQ